MLKFFIPLLLLVACSDNPPTTPETVPVDNPNAGNTAIYDVDPDDPYEVTDRAFLDMRPGLDIGPFSKFLRPGIIPVDGQDQTVYYIEGRKRERLGYLQVGEGDASRISEIHITSPNVVTRDGLRTGNSYREVIERLGPLDVVGGGSNGAAYLQHGLLAYRLSRNDLQAAFDPAAIDSTTKILEIVIK